MENRDELNKALNEATARMKDYRSAILALTFSKRVKEYSGSINALQRLVGFEEKSIAWLSNKLAKSERPFKDVGAVVEKAIAQQGVA